MQKSVNGQWTEARVQRFNNEKSLSTTSHYFFFVFNSNVHTRAKPFICLNSLLFIFQCPQFFYVATESTFIISIAFHAYV